VALSLRRTERIAIPRRHRKPAFPARLGNGLRNRRGAVSDASGEPSAIPRRRLQAGLVQQPFAVDTESYESVIGRLENAFDLFERGRVSHDTFQDMVLVEKRALERRHAELVRSGEEGTP